MRPLGFLSTTVRRRIGARLAWRLATLIGLLGVLVLATHGGSAQAATNDDWLTYGLNLAHTGFNAADPINANNAANLKEHWAHHAGGAINSQPIVDGALGLVFWGSWDGYEHATRISTNTTIWAHYLGTTFSSGCGPRVGVASTASVGTLNGAPVVYVGGGDSAFYALNANTGAIIWRTSLGSSPTHFIWGSPALFNGSVYIGIASLGDCPLIQGALYQLSAATGAVQHVFNVVPSGCTGGSVWGTPSIDTASGWVYFSTGNPGGCSSTETLADSVIKVYASNVSVTVDHWQAHTGDRADLDFASAPTLYSAAINGVSHVLLGIGSKDGSYYVLDRNAMSHGPIWRASIAAGGSCPQCGNGVIAPSAYDGTSLYVAGGNATLNGVACKGTLSALNPTNGAFRWRHCLIDGPVLGAVTVSGSPGVAFVGQGAYLMGISTATGQTLFRFTTLTSGSAFWGAPSVSNGLVFEGNQDGYLYALGF